MAQSTNTGTEIKLYNVAVSASWVLLTLAERTNNLLIRAREDMDLYVSDTLAGTNYLTVPSGQSITIELGSRNETPLYLSASGTGTAEILSTIE